MYIQTLVNGKPCAQTMLDTPSIVIVQIESWVRKLNFMVVLLDNFEVIFEDDYFVAVKVVLVQHLGGMVVLRRRTVLCSCKSNLDKARWKIVVVCDGLRKGKVIYLATLVITNPNEKAEVTDQAGSILGS